MGNCFGSPGHDSRSTVGTSHRSNTTGFSNASSNGRFFGAAGTEDAELEGEILETPNLKVFTFSDLKSATRNFKADNLLGEGGFGKVYKGWVDEKTLAPSKMGTGMVVAIKKLNSESVQGFDEWQSEVNFLGRLSHPNLVRLLGYCWEDKELLLVYEFMQKGSLENHLFRRNPSIEPLSWEKRLKIAIEAARGLAFLHTSDKQVIYRDFKASNILLDWSYNAKIADFGLAKLGPSGEESHVTTRVMGTFGYAAPEYVATGHLYVKSDVYGFGVVLLELLTGRRALDTRRPSKEQNLVDWAKPFLSQRGKLKNILDPRIEGQYSFKAALQTAQLALKCTAGEPRNRPSMKEVVDVLEHIAATKDKPKDAKARPSSAPKHGHQAVHFQRSPRHSKEPRSAPPGLKIPSPLSRPSKHFFAHSVPSSPFHLENIKIKPLLASLCHVLPIRLFSPTFNRLKFAVLSITKGCRFLGLTGFAWFLLEKRDSKSVPRSGLQIPSPAQVLWNLKPYPGYVCVTI